MFAAHTETRLLDAIDQGNMVVLPNRGAARALRQTYDERQRKAGLRAWEPAKALAWRDWTRSLWSDLAADGAELRLLLNRAQEHSLWREVIEAHTAGRTLSSPDALAGLAASAWALAAAYRATDRIRATANTFDSRSFAAWAESFAKIAATQRLLATAQVEEALAEHAASGTLRLDTVVLLAGFDELTPAQSALVDELRERRAEITHAAVEVAESASRSKVSCVVQTSRDELTFGARWIRSLFEEADPESRTLRVAVLLPDPEGSRAELESVFREVLAPELQPVSADLSAAPWEFPGGASLAMQPMIVDALALLRLVQGPVPVERVGALLRSPFLGLSSEHLAAARFDAHVLRRGPYLIPELDLEGLGRVVRSQSSAMGSNAFVPGWLKQVNDLRLARLSKPSQRSHGEWSELIRDMLRAANWPGDRTPTPAEFATARAWDTTLDLLATLDFRGERVAFAAALKALEELLQTARVNPLPANAPIQVMRPEEAEGYTFDAVVLLHATDESWPEPARPNPLLGWPLQKDLGLPGADPSRDAERARKRAESLVLRTGQMLVLSAAADERGALRPSPLVQQLGIEAVPAEEFLPPLPEVSRIEEEVAPDDVELPPLPSPELRGGTSVLRLQAACGFLAFAEMRLNAATPDICELGLDAAERGNLVHRALETFWTGTRSQAELRALSSEERKRRVDDAVESAFRRLSPPTSGWGTAYVSVQRERLRRLVQRWLDFELQRGPFTVRQREERTSIPVGPLQLRVQPDRIDDVEGGVVLVDYKTGHRAHHSNWLGDRPDDPQLPLYARLTKPGELQALLFARIRPGAEMRWLGMAANQSVLPRTKRQRFFDLDLRREEWDSVLTRLAEEFAAGRADVDPKNLAVTCEGCGQRLLCRINPAAFAVELDDEDAEEEI
ncbi:MAG TPA: PD-(D/E)XK nuclease family protein [Acidobacteriaceae bacterium]